MSVPDRPGDEAGGVATLSVPEIRDYGLINPEIERLLQEGHRRVRLVGADGQRLLVAGLTGPWEAVVEVEGNAGPELAAGLNCPNVMVVCSGSAKDGAGQGLRSGSLLIRGHAGDAVGYAQAGGEILVLGAAGHRAGLDQSGGWLILAGSVGRLAGERQTGGTLVAGSESIGPSFGLYRRGGRIVRLNPSEFAASSEVVEGLRPFLPWLPGEWGGGIRSRRGPGHAPLES